MDPGEEGRANGTPITPQKEKLVLRGGAACEDGRRKLRPLVASGECEAITQIRRRAQVVQGGITFRELSETTFAQARPSKSFQSKTAKLISVRVLTRKLDLDVQLRS